MKLLFNKSWVIVLTLLAMAFSTHGVQSVYASDSSKDLPRSFERHAEHRDDDDDSPAAPIVTAPPAVTNDTTPTIEGLAEEDTRVYVWYRDDSGRRIFICKNVQVKDSDDKMYKSGHHDDDDELGTWSCVSNVVLPEGEIELIVKAVDDDGDKSPFTRHVFTIDITPPDTTLDSHPTDPSNSADATFTFSSTETPATFECQLDDGGFTACSSPETYTGLTDGSHTFEVRSIDEAGNVDPTPASFTWTVSTVPGGTVGGEIQVLDGTTEIADGGTLDFGLASVGSTVIKTITVMNIGTTDLTLTEPISVPTGFSLVSSFGSLTLAPSASTTFQIQLDTSTAATYSGEVSFGNSDPDENPFNFTVSSTVTSQVQFAITASGAPTVMPGDPYTYTFNYTAFADVTDAQVIVTLPSHTTFISSDRSCTASTGSVTCDLGSLSAGDGSFQMTVRVDRLKKIATVHSLPATSYLMRAAGVAAVNGSATVNANVLNPFGDVPLSHWTLYHIQAIWAHGITTGCAVSPLFYCPEVDMSRKEMAVFVERGIHGSDFVPPVVPLTFLDTTGPYQYWIEALRADGITNGCGGGNYCPEASITRGEMAVFLLRAKHGGSYIPPAPTGTFWLDVPVTHWAAAWAEQLGREGITAGCGGGRFCPDQAVSRAEMAVLVQRTFELPLPTP
jgi:hypothetical protein